MTLLGMAALVWGYERHDLRKRGLTQSRWTMEQRVIHRLTALAGRLDEDA